MKKLSDRVYKSLKETGAYDTECYHWFIQEGAAYRAYVIRGATGRVIGCGRITTVCGWKDGKAVYE